jgi:AraC family transcriptional regulator, transcriptional activator of the genes for pyochelin and ferripyochelin receptors
MKREIIKSYDLPYIHEAAQILQKDPSRSFTVSSLALEVGINSFKLREGFKRLFSITIYQFRLNLRLRLVMQLLEETDLTIEQIAYKTGFDSRDSLSRCFKKKIRRSPSEWRNEQAAKAQEDLSSTLALFAVPSTN